MAKTSSHMISPSCWSLYLLINIFDGQWELKVSQKYSSGVVIFLEFCIFLCCIGNSIILDFISDWIGFYESYSKGKGRYRIGFWASCTDKDLKLEACERWYFVHNEMHQRDWWSLTWTYYYLRMRSGSDSEHLLLLHWMSNTWDCWFRNLGSWCITGLYLFYT